MRRTIGAGHANQQADQFATANYGNACTNSLSDTPTYSAASRAIGHPHASRSGDAHGDHAHVRCQG